MLFLLFISLLFIHINQKKWFVLKNNIIFLYFWLFFLHYPYPFRIHFPISRYRSGSGPMIRIRPDPQHWKRKKKSTSVNSFISPLTPPGAPVEKGSSLLIGFPNIMYKSYDRLHELSTNVFWRRRNKNMYLPNNFIYTDISLPRFFLSYPQGGGRGNMHL